MCIMTALCNILVVSTAKLSPYTGGVFQFLKNKILSDQYMKKIAKRAAKYRNGIADEYSIVMNTIDMI